MCSLSGSVCVYVCFEMYEVWAFADHKTRLLYARLYYVKWHIVDVDNLRFFFQLYGDMVIRFYAFSQKALMEMHADTHTHKHITRQYHTHYLSVATVAVISSSSSSGSSSVCFIFVCKRQPWPFLIEPMVWCSLHWRGLHSLTGRLTCLFGCLVGLLDSSSLIS